MFEKVTANRWRLTHDAKVQIGAVLILMRNEWQTAVENLSGTQDMYFNKSTQGTIRNYRKMIECMDRILARLEGTFDIFKLTFAAGLVKEALAMPTDADGQSQLINAAEAICAITGTDTPGDRSDSQGGYRLPSTPGGKASDGSNATPGN